MEINKAKTCCCLGQWSMRDSHLVRKVAVAADEAVRAGVDTFLCIGAGRYDEICARAVRDLQQRQKQPVRCLLVAADPDTPRFDPALHDGVIALGGDPHGLCRRLRYMVDHAGRAIAHVYMGGTLLASAMDYAEEQHLDIRYLTLTFLVKRRTLDKIREIRGRQKQADPPPSPGTGSCTSAPIPLNDTPSGRL